MAITLVDSTQGFLSTFDNLEPITIPEPTGIADNDVIYGWIVHRSGVEADQTITGFTQIDRIDVGTWVVWTGYKVASSESGAYSATTTQTVNAHGWAGVAVFRGVDTADIFEPDYVQGTHYVDHGSDLSPAPAAITTTTDGCMIVTTTLARVAATDITSVTVSSGYTEAESYVAGTTVTVAGLTQHKEQTTAGTETPGDVTWSNAVPCATFTFALKPGSSSSAAISGTATDTIEESDIVTGGKTVIITLTGDTFKAAGTGPIGTTAESNALLVGLDSAQVEATGWNAEVRDNLSTTDLVRTSSTVATITLPASASYAITAQETITVTVPTDVLVTAAGAITATPTFTVDSETVTLTDLTEGRVYQRTKSTDNASITVTGTYSGTPTAIQARIVDDGTDTEVVTWTTIDASPTGDAFSGSITVPSGGWYNVDVRYSNNTSITDSGTNAWGVGILVGTIGQSNMARWFTDGSGQTPNDLVRKYDGSWAVLGAASNGATGFANALITGLTTGIPVGLLDYGVGASGISSWQPAGANYIAFKAGVDATAQSGTGELEYVFWSQGEQDAGMAEATYETNLGNVITECRSDFVNGSDQTNLPFIIDELGRRTDGVDSEYDAIRKAHNDVAGATADVYIGGTKIDLSLVDTVHLDPASFTTIGQRMAQCVLFILGEETYYLGPTIANFIDSSATETAIKISHNGGSDFTPTSGIDGFEVLDDGTPETISAAVRTNATTITLTHGTVAGTKTARYHYGANPAVTAPVLDNSTLTLPLKQNRSISEEPEATTITVSGITGGASLSSLSYAVFDDTSIGAANVVKQGTDETTNADGDLTIDLTGLGIAQGTILTIIISDYTTSPTDSNRGAVCYGTAAA